MIAILMFDMDQSLLQQLPVCQERMSNEKDKHNTCNYDPQDVFTITLTKKMASYMKTLLPPRYSLQLNPTKTKKKEPNTRPQPKQKSKTKVQSPPDSKGDSLSVCESSQNLDQNGQIADKVISLSEKLESLQILSGDEKLQEKTKQSQESLLTTAIKKFLQMVGKNSQIEQILKKELQGFKERLENKLYKSFAVFEEDFSKLTKKLKTRKGSKELVNDLQAIFRDIESIYKCLSDSDKKSPQVTRMAEIKPDKTTKPARVRLSRSHTRNRKSIQKDLHQSKLPTVLFEVAEENQSEANSQATIDIAEVTSINQLLRKLRRDDQEDLLQSLGRDEKGERKFIKSLNRKEAVCFMDKIKNTLRRNGFSINPEEIEIQSSFEIESDSE